MDLPGLIAFLFLAYNSEFHLEYFIPNKVPSATPTHKDNDEAPVAQIGNMMVRSVDGASKPSHLLLQLTLSCN